MHFRRTGWLGGALKRSNLSSAGMGILRVTLLFGSAAIALTLLTMPDSERRTRQAIFDPGIDNIVTSSFGSRSNARQIVGILPPSSDACIISRDGTKRGNC